MRFGRKNRYKNFSISASGDLRVWVFGLAIAAIIGVLVAGSYFANTNAEYVTATVSKTERTGGEDSKYLVFTDKETFKVADSLWQGNHNSSDLYGRLVAGKTYKFKVVGWRSGVMSSYRNIVEAKEVKVTPKQAR